MSIEKTAIKVRNGVPTKKCLRELIEEYESATGKDIGYIYFAHSYGMKSTKRSYQ